MLTYFLIRYLHVLGAMAILGAGSGNLPLRETGEDFIWLMIAKPSF